MDGWLKGLIAATCLAVLGGVGWHVRWDAQADRAAAELAEATEQAATLRQRAQMRDTCEDQITAWEGGDRQDILDEFGRYSQDVIDDCHDMIVFWDALPTE